MMTTTDPLDDESDIRTILGRHIDDFDTAKAIKEEAAKVDQPAPDGNPFSVVLADDVLNLIAEKMSAGHITKTAIYYLARYSVQELDDHLRQLRVKESQHMSAIAKRPRRKQWADELAADLIKKHKTFHEAWRSIPKDDHSIGSTRYAGYEVWREGGVLHASSSKGDDSIKRESFRTGYFVRANKA